MEHIRDQERYEAKRNLLEMPTHVALEIERPKGVGNFALNNGVGIGQWGILKVAFDTHIGPRERAFPVEEIPQDSEEDQQPDLTLRR